MVEFKLCINDSKSGKSYAKTISGEETYAFKNKKIKDKVMGNTFGFKNYEFEITGGSDNAGFPMRYDLNIQGRKRILLTKGPCVKIKRKGMRKRKTVRGNIITPVISQINLKVLKVGDKKIEEIFPKPEEKKEETKKEEPVEKKESPKEEKPKEEKNK
ncbi:MAG: 30S ribosomal protein S6e [Nanoarchaeota archaeon]|nr:30S ribosomal protein S6e [Nanoarchaeota archaeon]